jgi:hypothetical protein
MYKPRGLSDVTGYPVGAGAGGPPKGSLALPTSHQLRARVCPVCWCARSVGVGLVGWFDLLG